ncbi:hypothetical protein ACN08X_01755 [Rothia sp. P6271]|uniref:hypothetical protein n=1 Tax=unclassified Rothia (in: high G+C Gram-positive bacteria) TaxID=2689056 RepID=UPI003AD01B5C
MPERDTVPSVASEFTEAMNAVSDTSVQVREISSLTLVRIQVAPDSVAAARMSQVLGIDFPRHRGEVTGDSQAREILYGTRQIVAALWVHEDTFLIATHVDPIKLGRALDRALGSEPGLVLDVSANRTVIELSGEEAPEVLARCVTFEDDATPELFDIGMGWRCNVGEAELMLWRIDRFEYLMVPRSSTTAPFLVTLLDTIEKVKN